jgi:spermidine/putrescine transport system ATP-binding protein
MSDRLAVMHQGEIEQIGPPEEVYENPATAFVAGFLGASNLLDGTVTGRDGGRVTVAVSGGETVTVPEERVNGNETDGRVRVGVRPEKITLEPDRGDPPAGSNSVTGVLRVSTYVGVSHQFTVDGPDGTTLTVYAQNLGAGSVPAAGERVRLVWRPEHTFVVASSSPPTGEEAEE